jgi:tetratricopeptide (TPR) repeat protein
LAKTARKTRIATKDLKFRNDPMVRFYERTQDYLQDRTRPFLIGAGIVIGVVALYFIGSWIFSSRSAHAQEAFAKAYDKYKAPVVDGPTTTQTGTYYTDETQKWQDTAKSFEDLANDYGSFAAIGNYYAGVSYLHLADGRDKGIALLKKAVDKNEQPTSDLAQLALAEGNLTAGDAQTAIQIFEKLLKSKYVPAVVVQTNLGEAYEKAGDKQKAIDAYFEAAKTSRATTTSSDAEKRLAVLAPEKIKDLPAFDPLAAATP